MRDKVAWRCVTTMPGALSVMTRLELQMQQSYVLNLVSMELVRIAITVLHNYGLITTLL